MTLSSILDEIQPTLPPLLWDSPESPEPKLKPAHKRWIVSSIHRVLTDAGYTDIDSWLRLYLTGSLTTTQYSDSSDCDVSLFVSSEHLPDWSRAEMIGVMVGHLDGTKLPGTPYVMQDFIVGKGIAPGDLYKPGLRSGYDILEDRWIAPPDPSRAHDVEAQENGWYTYALMQADKMEHLLRYEKDKAILMWHQLHKKRMVDQTAGKGDFSAANIVMKFLAKRGLMPAISEVSGERIAVVKSSVDHQAMAIDSHWLDNWIARNGPYLYHGSRTADPDRVLREGLRPGRVTSPTPGESDTYAHPRPDHVYMSASPMDYPHIYRIDLRQLDPANLAADEDIATHTDAYKTYGLEGSPSVDAMNLDLDEVDPTDPRWPTRGRGEWFDQHPSADDPGLAAMSLENNGTIAHRGTIPPSAISYEPGTRIAAKLAAPGGIGFGTMYHVSPRMNREAIQAEGLRGYDRPTSPWSYSWPQPSGNYLFDNLNDARNYAGTLHSVQHGRTYQDEEDRYEYPEQPEGFDDWPPEKQDNWYDDEGQPFERQEDPRGYDIHAVQTHGLSMAPDPEFKLAPVGEKNEGWDLGRLHDQYQDEAQGYADGWRPGQHPSPENLHEGVGQTWGTEPRRYLVPGDIHPSRVSLAEHIPSWNLSQDEDDYGYEYRQDEYPQPWAAVPMTEWPMPGHESKTFKVAGLDHQSVLDSNAGLDLEGLPGPINVPGTGPLHFHSSAPIQQMAEDYGRRYGIPQRRPTDYRGIDPAISARIAQEYERMRHDPNDPAVRASYEALAKETRDQYDHAVQNGYQFEFYPPDRDPYPNSPREAVLDLHHNRHMYVYPTSAGYGSDDQNLDHPLLADSGVRWNGQPVTHNDLFRCFVPGTLVRTRRGYVPIEVIDEGDEVLTAKGRYRRVTHTMKRQHQGPMQSIGTNASFEPIVCTPDHRFWVLQGGHRKDKLSPCTPYICDRKQVSGNVTPQDRYHKFVWAEAQDLVQGGWFPAITDSSSKDTDAIEVPAAHIKRSGTGPTRFDLDEDFLWVAGFYIAEGSSVTGANRVAFTFNVNETLYRRKLIDFTERHGYGWSERTTGNEIQLSINSAVLNRWFPELFGKGANNKRIPEVLLRLPASKLIHLIRGVYDGDGRKNGRNNIDQTSIILALQLFEAGQKLGFQPTTGYLSNANEQHHDVYRVHEFHESGHAFTQKKYTRKMLGEDCRQVTSVDSAYYDGWVYDIEVEEDHSFVVQGVPVHNCVHDLYGHAKEGVGFRAVGEDNAFRQHAGMFSPTALPAMTAETRGQNSYVNFGPNGEYNQTAGQGDTVYAPQKAGVMPAWTSDPDLHPQSLPQVQSSVHEADKPKDPPHYRLATKSPEACLTCEMFDHRDKTCWGYGNKKVKADHVCDSWKRGSKVDQPGFFSRVASSSVAETAAAAAHSQGGITIGLDGVPKTEGFAFCPTKQTELRVSLADLTPEVIEQFIQQNLSTLSMLDNYLGLWVDDGTVYIDVSRVLPDEQQALAIAAANHQLAIFDLNDFREIRVPEAAVTPVMSAAKPGARVLYNKFRPDPAHPGKRVLPWIYDPKDDVVHLGPAGAYHWQLINRTPELRSQFDPETAWSRASTGMGAPGLVHGTMEWPSKESEFLSRDAPHEVKQRINEALGGPPPPEPGPEVWDFSG